MQNVDQRVHLPWYGVTVLSVAAGFLSALLGTVVHVLQVPLYLDSIMTIVVTMHLGLLPGVVTAVVTNGILAASGQILFPFVCCNLLTAMITWLFARNGGLRGPSGFAWLGLAVAVTNGFFGSVLAYIIYSGVTTVHGIDRLVMGLVVTGQSLLTAVFWSGMVTNLVDKMVSVLLAYISRGWVREKLRTVSPAFRSVGHS